MKPIKIRGDNPHAVAISRDTHGVPHVEAKTLAGVYWAMGYCHALDRGMQMCLMRLLGQGRAAECLDGSDETVEIDRFFRRMNWHGQLDSQRETLAPDVDALCLQYCAGVDAILQHTRRLEFRMVGYRPDPWRVEDSIMMSRMIGYLTLAQSQAEVERLFVEMVQAGIPDDKLRALFPGCLGDFQRELVESVTLGERVVPEAVQWLGSGARVMASNNWVIAGRKTASGKPIMANDPHLEVNRLPNVWCELVLRREDGANFAGMTMPGIPAPLIGRTDHLAWGATYAFMDSVDSWVEDCRDGEYRRGDGEDAQWLPFAVRRETIKRKKGEPVVVEFYENEHGVLDGDPHKAGRYLTTRWAPSTSGAKSLMSAHAMFDATTAAQGMAALGQLATAWNWVFADSDGHIGYQMSGWLPKRAEGVAGFVPMPGWDPAYDWQGFVDAEDLPRCLDPADGYLVTANQDLNHLGVESRRPITMPMGDYRARRIANLLAARDDHSLATCSAIHMDVMSLQAEEFMAILAPSLGDDPVSKALAKWEFGYETTSVGASAFEAFYAQLRLEVFAPDGFGAAVIEHLAKDTGVFIDFYQHFDRLLLDADSPWYGGRSQAACFAAALAKTPESCLVQWGTQNHFEMTNIFFGGKLPGFLGFDKGPFPLRGGRATPHQGQVYASAGRATSFAPSVRMVADLGEAVIHTSMAGGPSDRRFSRWYASGTADWLEGRLKRMTP